MSILFGGCWNWNSPTPVSDNLPNGRLGLEHHVSILFGWCWNIPTLDFDNLSNGTL